MNNGGRVELFEAEDRFDFDETDTADLRGLSHEDMCTDLVRPAVLSLFLWSPDRVPPDSREPRQRDPARSDRIVPPVAAGDQLRVR